MPSEAHPAGEDAPIGAYGQHYATATDQREAAQMGMWLFLVNEVLLFGGLFAAYTMFRYRFPVAFAVAGRQMDLTLGTVNTVVLITSSLTVAMAIHYARTDQPRHAGWMVLASLFCAVAFLVIKSQEYLHHFHEGTLPGRFYSNTENLHPGAAMFATLYFFMTGLHALHVLIGMGVLGWVAVGLFQGRYSSRHYTPVELGGMYWHLVDLIWIFLYPLLYLI